VTRLLLYQERERQDVEIMNKKEQIKRVVGSALGLLSTVVIFISIGLCDTIATGHYFAKLQLKLESALSRSANIRLIAQDPKYEDFFSRLPDELRRFIEITSLIQKDKLFEARKIIEVPSIKFQDINSTIHEKVDNLIAKQLEIENISKEINELDIKRDDLNIDEKRISKEKKQLKIGVLGDKVWRENRKKDLDRDLKALKEERKRIAPRKKELSKILDKLVEEKITLKRQATSAANMEIITMIVSTLDDETKKNYNELSANLREVGVDLPTIRVNSTNKRAKLNLNDKIK
jgi:hypothetical protein